MAKAWISNISEKKDTATAIGTYTGFQSVFTMMASAFAGWVWFAFGASATFNLSAIGALLLAAYFTLLVGRKTNSH